MNNREIKFRVWNNKTKQWIHGPGHEVNLFGEMILLGGFMHGVRVEELNDCVVLQYTGLKDKNNKEIYEGDVLKSINRTAHKYIKVEFKNGCFLFENRTFDEFVKYNDIKIVGNIYETPELLK